MATASALVDFNYVLLLLFEFKTIETLNLRLITFLTTHFVRYKWESVLTYPPILSIAIHFFSLKYAAPHTHIHIHSDRIAFHRIDL